MKKLFLILLVCSSPLFAILGCQDTKLTLYGAGPTPTNTPSFNQCSQTTLLTPNPWSGSGTGQVAVPPFTGTASVEVKIFDSTYSNVRTDLHSGQTSPATLPVTPANAQGTPLPNGNYYLELDVTGSGPATCYYDTFVRN